jgi:hypothetical protein
MCQDLDLEQVSCIGLEVPTNVTSNLSLLVRSIYVVSFPVTYVVAVKDCFLAQWTATKILASVFGIHWRFNVQANNPGTAVCVFNYNFDRLGGCIPCGPSYSSLAFLTDFQIFMTCILWHINHYLENYKGVSTKQTRLKVFRVGILKSS